MAQPRCTACSSIRALLSSVLEQLYPLPLFALPQSLVEQLTEDERKELCLSDPSATFKYNEATRQVGGRVAREGAVGGRVARESAVGGREGGKGGCRAGGREGWQRVQGRLARGAGQVEVRVSKGVHGGWGRGLARGFKGRF